jgi:hypothetical protein
VFGEVVASVIDGNKRLGNETGRISTPEMRLGSENGNNIASETYQQLGRCTTLTHATTRTVLNTLHYSDYMSTTSCGIRYGRRHATPIAVARNSIFHRQLGRRVATVVFLSTIWLATKDNKQG